MTHVELPLRRREDDAVVAAQVHEGKETQQSVVVGIEIAVFERHVLGFPESLDEFAALIVAAHHGGSSRRGHQSDTMTQFPETTCLQNLVSFGKRAIHAVLIHKRVDALTVEEVLDALTIGALPFGIGTAPFIVECDIHGHAP